MFIRHWSYQTRKSSVLGDRATSATETSFFIYTFDMKKVPRRLINMWHKTSLKRHRLNLQWTRWFYYKQNDNLHFSRILNFGYGLYWPRLSGTYWPVLAFGGDEFCATGRAAADCATGVATGRGGAGAGAGCRCCCCGACGFTGIPFTTRFPSLSV